MTLGGFLQEIFSKVKGLTFGKIFFVYGVGLLLLLAFFAVKAFVGFALESPDQALTIVVLVTGVPSTLWALFNITIHFYEGSEDSDYR